MKNPSGNKLEKLVFGMFDQMVEGADKYVTKQGSTWLIFTESKKWVIEFTKDKTLWFNYNIFQGELELIGKDCTEERDLIKSWFESRFLNKPKVWATFNHAIDSNQAVEDTIQNGVKDTYHFQSEIPNQVEDAIQEGVKRTFDMEFRNQLSVEDTIQEGVKYTQFGNGEARNHVEDTIENGVKHTIDEKSTLRYVVKDTIQNGVKETQTRMWPPVGAVEDTIQNGVKDIDYLEGLPMEHVEYTIQNGVKQTSHSEDEDLDDVEDTIQNGVKHTIDLEFRNKFIIEDTIQNGVKYTDYGYDREESYIEDAIENGVKDVRTPGVGDLESTMDFMNENNTLDVQKLLDDVIENGVKEAKEDRLFRTIRVMNTIKNGVKETKESMLESSEQKDHNATTFEITENINDAIENGVKELKVWKSNRCEEHGYFEFVDGIPTYTPMIQVKDVLENGVKEIQPLPARDGNRDWGLYYQRQGNLTKPHTEYVKEVIEDSYNHISRVEGVIRNTDKDGI
jgi:hypothetical protein